MPRRVRLKRALPALATVLVTSSLQALGALPALAASQRVGVWLTNSPSPLYYDANLIEKAVAELDAAGFNTLYP
ncbi:MAG: hypothetical protein WBN80_11885, partial [Prochlorococcaceae cyanobacterium]